MATTTHLTIDDFERLPAEMAENHELVDGELVPVSGNNLKHNSIKMRLSALIHHAVVEQSLGTVVTEQEYDFDGNAHGPDISFFDVSKEALADPNKRVQRFVPDLAIEIVSTHDTFNSLVSKKNRYRSCGTEEVWIISPESREVLVYSTRGDHILREDATLATELIPGFQIPVKQLF